MSTLDWLLVFAACGLVPVHIYYGIRYREFFVTSKATMNVSYWSMIAEFKKHHPTAGGVLVAVVWLQAAIVAAFAISLAFS